MGRAKAPESFRDSLPRIWHVLQRLWPKLRKQAPLLAVSSVAMLLQIGLQLLKPWPLKFVIDYLAGSDVDSGPLGLIAYENVTPMALVALAALAVLVVAALGAVANYASTVGMALAGQRVLTDLRRELYHHLLRLPLAYHTKARSGDLISRITGDIGRLRDVTVTAAMPLLAHTLTLVGMVLLMFWMNWQLGLLALAAYPLVSLAMVRFSRRIQGVARDQRKREGVLAAAAGESIGAIRVVKAYSLEAILEEKFGRQNKKSLKEGAKSKRLSVRLGSIVDILIACSTALVLWYGSSLVLRGSLTPGDLIVFLSYLKGAFRPTRSLAKYTGRIAKATASGERVLDILEQTPELRRSSGLVPAPRFQGAVDFYNVDFAYEPGHEVLKRASFWVRPGEQVALVGPSGSGKSTLMSLLLRFFEPTGGRITIDGRDIRKYSVESVRRQISIVLQESVLFAASVRENIAFGSPDASFTEIKEAAALANAHDFILGLPQGYETVLGERGATLSGGERQRIAIARAALRQAPIVILDEPTTGLDKENEQIVREALKRLTKGRTVFIIVHDLRLARDADRIFYLENGTVLEGGTAHEQLMQIDGRYAAAYSLQSRANGGQRLQEDAYAVAR